MEGIQIQLQGHFDFFFFSPYSHTHTLIAGNVTQGLRTTHLKMFSQGFQNIIFMVFN